MQRPMQQSERCRWCWRERGAVGVHGRAWPVGVHAQAGGQESSALRELLREATAAVDSISGARGPLRSPARLPCRPARCKDTCQPHHVTFYLPRHAARRGCQRGGRLPRAAGPAADVGDGDKAVQLRAVGTRVRRPGEPCASAARMSLARPLAYTAAGLACPVQARTGHRVCLACPQLPSDAELQDESFRNDPPLSLHHRSRATCCTAWLPPWRPQPRPPPRRPTPPPSAPPPARRCATCRRRRARWRRRLARTALTRAPPAGCWARWQRRWRRRR
jgi:hypothetical protein